MNYLAHAWLSFHQPEILVGNMISDFIKGKQRFAFSPAIQKGIMLHRNIDTFTDGHAATKHAKQFFKPAVGLYAGAFVDVAYDHFLATDNNEFNDKSLQEFSLFAYTTLEKFQSELPVHFSVMLPYMKKDNWLYNYKTLPGIEKSFQGLLRRAKYLETNNNVFENFKMHYNELRECYNNFFPSVKSFAYNLINL